MRKKNFFIAQALLAFVSLNALATITISPTSIELSETSLIGELTLENQGTETKLFETSIKKWTQKNNEDIFESTDDIIILPLSINLAQNKKQKFRIVLRKPAQPKTQGNYRLFFTEMLKHGKPSAGGISFLLNINVPITSNGKQLSIIPEPVWLISKAQIEEMGELSITNKGAAKIVISDLIISEKTETKLEGMHPILPGATYRWKIPLKDIKSDKIKLKYKIQGKPEILDLKIASK